MVEIKNLQVTKNGTTICTVPELSIAPSERLGILGSNGAGKTTLLRVLAGLEIDFQGTCDVRVPRKERVYIHQNPYLFRGTVLSNATYGLHARGMRRAEAEELALGWLEKLGIRQLASHGVTHLSGGERRRTALVRALVLKPRLLLLDEPLAEMDEPGVTSLYAAIRELDDSTILVASPAPVPQGLTTREYWLR